MRVGRRTSGMPDDWSAEVVAEIALLERVTAAIRQATAERNTTRRNVTPRAVSDAVSDYENVIDLEDERRKRAEPPLFY